MTPDYALLKRQNPITAYLKRNNIPVIHLKFSCVIAGHTDRNPSASIFDDDERWRCHACDDGGDIIDLVRHHRGMTHAEAVRHLGGESWDGEPKPPPRKGSRPQLVREYGPPPEDAPALKLPKLTLLKKDQSGTYEKGFDHLYPYRDKNGVLQAYVGRIDASDEQGKSIHPIRWHLTAKAWTQKGFTKGEWRPLFNEDKLSCRLGDEVLLVEGEKCVVVAEALFPHMVVVTWIGGKGQVQDADFSALKGRHVTLWQDNDEEGRQAMDVAARKAQAAVLLTVPMAKDWQPGWDVIDVADSAPGAADEVLRTRKPYRFDESPKGQGGKWLRSADGGWLPDEADPITGPTGQIKTNSTVNATLALLYHPAFISLSFDIMRREIQWEGRALTESRFHVLQGRLFALTGLDIAQGFETVLVRAALARPVHVLADRMRALAWDKVKRVDRLFTYFGVTASDWAVCGFRRWFLGHVKRILEPGWKQDLILVLEGPQGQGKSTALDILAHAFGHEGYARIASLGSGRMNENDLMLIAGKTIVELGEMTAVRKAELDHFKDITSRNFDEYRAPYARDMIRVQRTASFAGTTNLDQDYLTDPTGARRFVPMFCEHAIDLEGLKADREQLYAEALALIDGDEPTWFTEEEEELQAVEVEKRQSVGYVRTMLEEAIETIDQDFIPLNRLWADLGVPENAFRERKLAFEEIKRAMLELGWTFQRQTVEDDDSVRRLKGFARQASRRGRRWHKRQLFPPD